MKLRNETIKSLLLTGSALLASSALSAPMTSLEKLPVDEATINALKDKGYSEKRIENFIIALNELDFYPDHKNPLDTSNRRQEKLYYSAPYLSPSESRHSVGSETFAKYALEIIDEADNLVATMDFNLKEFQRLTLLRSQKDDLIKKYKKRLLTENDDNQRAALNDAIAGLESDIASHTAELKKLTAQGVSEVTDLGPLAKRIVENVVYQFSRLGYAPDEATSKLLNSSNSSEVMRGLALIRSKVANGQYGLKQVVLESGLSKDKVEIFSTYRQIRPDVKFKSMGFTKLYVKPAAQTGKDRNSESEAVMIRDINRSSQSELGRGECGNARSCSVTLEYTNIGARAAMVAQAGSTILPVTFAGDVRVFVPDFSGSFDCKFENGWWAKGRADVKDGGIIYDGDVTNKIKFESVNEQEYCDIDIREGDKDSAAWHILHDLDKYYQNLFSQRTIESKQAKEKYENYVRSEIDRHANQSQNRNKHDYMSYVYGWASGAVSGWATFGVAVVSEARDFYWHTRVEDTSSFDKVEIHKDINYRNVTEMTEFAFDGFAITCRKNDANGKRIVACSENMLESANTEQGVSDEFCDNDTSVAQCVQDVEDSTEVTEDGFLDIF